MDWAGHPELIEQIRTMATEGLSATQIAVAMGMGLTRNAVCGIGFRKGISFKGLGGSSNHTPRPRKPRPEPMFRPKPTYRNVESEIKPEPVQALMLTLMELTDKNCHFPHGDPRSPDFRYCGRSVYEDLPYCLDCCRIMYVPPEERKRASQNQG